MRFDLTDLRLFLNVHEAGTITGGAEASNMTLASASERIRGMEESLRTALLLRDRRGVRPTPAGRTLLHHAQLVLQQMERLQSELGAYGTGLRGHIRLLCNTSALSEHLPEVMGSFLASHPGISVDLEERTSDEIVDAIRNKVGDIGLVSDTADMEGLQTLDFRADPLVLVVPRDHALAQKSQVDLSSLLHLEFVGLADGSALQDHIARHARRLGTPLAYRVRLRSLDSVCRMVGQGIGVGIVPKAVALRMARVFRISRVGLSDAWANRRLVICARSVDGLPLPARHLIQHMYQVAHRP